MSNINEKVGSATKWSIFTEIVVKLISPITNMILARILAPGAFGVVATVTMIISFTDIFTDAGFQKYIVQHQFKNEDDEDLSICVAFWTNICISIVFWLLIFVFSDQLAYSVGNAGLGRVIYIGALVLPLTSFSSIQTAIYRKSLKYKTISIARITVKIIPLIVTVPLAIYGFSYWALIIGNIIGEFCNAVLLTVLSNWKPKLRYSFSKLKEMFSFCGWTLLETISSWLVTNVGIFVIGRLFNEYHLGIYKTGTTMVAQITSLISGATISVLFSALSRLQNDEQEYRKMYFAFLKGIGLLVIPLGVGIYLYKDVVRLILLGDQWGEADLLVGFWGFILAESVIFNDMSGTLILSKGHPKLLFVSNMIQAILMIPALWISSRYGFKAMVITSCFVRIQLPITQTYMAYRVSKIGMLDILKQVKWYILATIIMAIIGVSLINGVPNQFSRYFSIGICILSYFTVLLVIPNSRGELLNYLNVLKKKFK
ncbi:lipopolysaccharide biosynthesis protein [Streptococcus porci]|uniref:lipopolysaccharide biosynthesis protein n=1 Tax=Streptococcus porci TaxID=502567 RepID=UPI0003FB1053|nr:lipopolysaccharide biosynthesis protein [Streptococcus porci]